MGIDYKRDGEVDEDMREEGEAKGEVARGAVMSMEEELASWKKIDHGKEGGTEER